MKRGFKSAAEKRSEEIRRELGLSPRASLRMRALAKHLGLTIVKPSAIPGIPELIAELMCAEDNNDWSAMMLPAKTGSVIIYNSGHSERRQESDLAHEIAHHLCGHRPETLISSSRGALLTNYDEEQEEEAKWLGGCLQLPRVALIGSVYDGLTDEEIATKYFASEQMTRFRMNVTGARKIHARSLAKGRN